MSLLLYFFYHTIIFHYKFSYGRVNLITNYIKQKVNSPKPKEINLNQKTLSWLITNHIFTVLGNNMKIVSPINKITSSDGLE